MALCAELQSDRNLAENPESRSGRSVTYTLRKMPRDPAWMTIPATAFCGNPSRPGGRSYSEQQPAATPAHS